MDRARHKSSPSSERLLGSFLPPSAAGDQPGSVAFELDEDDLFASGAPSPERPQPPRRPLLISSIRAANPSPTIPRLRRPPGGILEALPERFGPLSPPLSSSSTSSSPASSMTALSRMIPSIPRPAPAPTMHMPQSAPVNVPAARLRRPPVVDEFTAEADEDDDEEMLPPHEMVARSRARESPMTTFSVLEGAGCTLKGRDLLQVLGHVCYHILAAGLNGYMATVTNVKSPLNKWRCGAALISSMMTVKRWSRGPASSAMD